MKIRALVLGLVLELALLPGTSARATCGVIGVVTDVQGEGARLKRLDHLGPLTAGVRLCSGDVVYAGQAKVSYETASGWTGRLHPSQQKRFAESEIHANGAENRDVVVRTETKKPTADLPH